MKPNKFKVSIPKFGLRAFIMAAGLLWLISLALGYLGQVATYLEAPVWAVAGLRLLSYIAGTLLALLAVYRLWGLTVQFGLFLWSLISETETVSVGLDDAGSVEEGPEIAQAIGNLAEILDQIEADSRQARTLLVDAATYTGMLVDLVQAIAGRAEEMMAEIDQLNQALAAIKTGDGVQIATAAGEISDAHIRSLMTTEIKHADYWDSVARLIGSQLGTLRQWERGYRRFAGSLLVEVSKAKGRLASLEASNDLVGTSRPLMQIQANLNQAGHHLQLEQTPVRQIAQLAPVAGRNLWAS
jgi:hypothetical protein